MLTPLALELDRQLDRLVELGYPALAGLTVEAFRTLAQPLRPLVPASSYLLVVRSTLVPTVDAVERWTVAGKAGWTDMADELAGFRPTADVAVPDADLYLLTDVSTGAETLGVTPADALPQIAAHGRTPLTIDEGVALVTQHPDVFETHNAFQALGSRAANKRIPSFWVSKGAPRLGWCWLNNPHSWLGSASAEARLAA
ncbi:MAG TPA: DUF5701 family protein [Marmoricola sp.]|nr:DUF5701 family protein [Marmoricola sp.]